MVNDNSDKDEFELVFEGPSDDSPDTLRSLKGALIADLDFSIAEVQHFLESAPLTIKRSAEMSELEVACNKLKRAGGKLFIVQRAAATKQPEAKQISSFLGFDLEEALKTAEQAEQETTLKPEATSAAPVQEPEQENELIFELDLSTEHPHVEEPQEPPSYALTETSLDELEPDLIQAPELEDRASEEAKPSDNLLELALDEPVAAAQTSKTAAEKVAAPAHTPIKSEEIDLTLAMEEPEPAPATPTKTVSEQKQTEPPAPEPAFEINLPKPNVLKQLVAEGEKIASVSKSPTTAEAKEPASEPATKETTKLENGPSFHGIVPSKSSSSIRRDSGLMRKASNPTLLYSGLAVMVLLATNWYYLKDNTKGLDSKQIDRILQTVTADLDRSGKNSDKTELSDNAQAQGLKGEKILSAFTITWDLETDKEAISAGTITLTTPPAPKLSALEIAQGKIAPPWLRKINMERLKFEKNSDNLWQASTLAKAYLEYDGRGYRLVADAKISLAYEPAAKSIKGSLNISHGYEQAPANSAFAMERTGPEEFKLYLKTDF